ncbi:uncharacterized protein B0H64DRAFT_120899 [Chaetomium fimeti]|uniref:Ribosomal protein bL31m N-terminal domain-containing protein n=1 Tax=Chaetomium fimeti TaxID=1854472 RepID=A0AAE0HKC6_9PEZI|nr:hypothetical protein B0H64DRAFT_120899 [Chaetomium fimeti]
MGKLPSTLLRRPSLAGYLPSTSPALPHHTPTTAGGLLSTPQKKAAAAGQVRHATFVPRSRRPYQFTQLVQLSDGSTFTVRTTSPLALYRSAKDSRNHILWQPTEKSLRNVEVDEAGKLAAFRERYGSSWDLDAPTTAAGADAPGAGAAAPGAGDAAAASKEGGEKGPAVEKKGAAEEKGDKKQVDAKEAKPAAAQEPAEAAASADPFDSLVDLISTYASEDKNTKGGLSAKDQARKEKKKK